MSFHRYNKLGLDSISLSGKTLNKIDEMRTYAPVASSPISQLSIKSVAIGTAHAAIVTGMSGHVGSEVFGSGYDWISEMVYSSMLSLQPAAIAIIEVV